MLGLIFLKRLHGETLNMQIVSLLLIYTFFFSSSFFFSALCSLLVFAVCLFFSLCFATNSWHLMPAHTHTLSHLYHPQKFSSFFLLHSPRFFIKFILNRTCIFNDDNGDYLHEKPSHKKLCFAMVDVVMGVFFFYTRSKECSFLVDFFFFFGV